jgi:tRNA-Thr(GGU) m(6)t(6)A37 methyltransferase TsaA
LNFEPVILKPIGIIHTPYEKDAPFMDYEGRDGEFYIEVFESHAEGLYLLGTLKYCYILFYIHKQKKVPRPIVYPPRGNGKKVGLFATRSPNRINPIGLTVARMKKVEGNRIYTNGLDILDRTPLLDIKPYIRDFDMKPDSNFGWIDPEVGDGERWREKDE